MYNSKETEMKSLHMIASSPLTEYNLYEKNPHDSIGGF
jgi:hypothetical protein